MNTAKKKVVFLTGTRADFGKLKPLIQRLAEDDQFEHEIFATGMHLLSRYGYTLDEIEKSGLGNLHIFPNQTEEESSAMDFVLANTIHGLGAHIRKSRPDLIVVHGDRVETLAGAIVGALNNVLVAHIEGGELSGTIDELIRHAVSKLSHVHFVANEEAATRLRQMGEVPESIFVVGSPDIDVMLSDHLPPLDEVQRRYEIPFADYAIFLYHPVTTELEVLGRHLAAVVEALRLSGRNFVVIYPNNDSGSDQVFAGIDPLRLIPKFRLLPSMRFEYFLSLLKHASAIVGNSSAGIREAPVYGVPTINLGTRQLNRFSHASITNVAEESVELLELLRNPPARIAPSMHFGEGRSAELFLQQLREVGFWRTPCQKQFQVLPVGKTSDAARTD
jgi:UDP-N-acetylglucosamine 2-epimerase (hydrolysing)